MASNLPVPAKHAKNDADTDARLRDKMAEIDALVEAMANEEPDCDLKLAALVEEESEAVRISIVEAIREKLREQAAEKERELDQYLAADRKLQVQRQRNIFLQWLQWIMSEETLRKIRMAFLASPGLSQQVRNIGHELAQFGVQQQLDQQRQQRGELGGLSANVSQSQGAGRGKDDGKGRS